jgi:RND family efflux transporter MFP subunit
MRQSKHRLKILLSLVIPFGFGLLMIGSSMELPDGPQRFLVSIGLAAATSLEDPETEPPHTVAVGKGSVRHTVIAPGQAEYVDTHVLAAISGGQLASILVRPGDSVRQGTALAELDRAPWEAALRSARLEQQQAEEAHQRTLLIAGQALQIARVRLQTAFQEHARSAAEAELSLTKAQLHLEQARLAYPSITSARIQLNNAIESEQVAAREYQEAVERRDANWEPPEIADRYLIALKAAQDARAIAESDFTSIANSQASNNARIEVLETEVQLAQIAVDRLGDGIDPLLQMEVQNRQALLDGLQTSGVDSRYELAVETAILALDATTVTAPFDGLILEVEAGEGQTVSPGEALFLIADPTTMEVTSTVIEEDLPLLAIGQKAELFFDAIPDTIFQGRLTHICPQRVRHQDRPLYEVSIQLDGLPLGLTSGMTADATVIIQERREVLRLPRAMVRAGKSEITVASIWDGHAVTQHEIRLGLRGDLYIEILEGLREGDLVVSK